MSDFAKSEIKKIWSLFMTDEISKYLIAQNFKQLNAGPEKYPWLHLLDLELYPQEFKNEIDTFFSEINYSDLEDFERILMFYKELENKFVNNLNRFFSHPCLDKFRILGILLLCDKKYDVFEIQCFCLKPDDSPLSADLEKMQPSMKMNMVALLNILRCVKSSGSFSYDFVRGDNFRYRFKGDFYEELDDIDFKRCVNTFDGIDNSKDAKSKIKMKTWEILKIFKYEKDENVEYEYNVKLFIMHMMTILALLSILKKNNNDNDIDIDIDIDINIKDYISERIPSVYKLARMALLGLWGHPDYCNKKAILRSILHQSYVFQKDLNYKVRKPLDNYICYNIVPKLLVMYNILRILGYD